MDTFVFYLKMGIRHITDIGGFDHMLFIAALCAVYHWTKAKSLIILLTAFTIGHSVTLALSATNWIHVNAELVETLIPITIILTALVNLGELFGGWKNLGKYNYIMAILFGFIHGMGFSNYFRSLFSNTENILWELFAFNVGVEIGQILFFLGLMILYYICEKGFSVRPHQWNIFWSVLAIVLSSMILMGIL